jgi:hypothetical protein
MFYITDLVIIGFTYLFMTSFENSLHYLISLYISNIILLYNIV